jgi:hypothetical protein
MALWKPQSSQPIGPNEHLGRRLFDEPSLAGAQDQKTIARLNLRHFEERRDGQVSLDRLGRTNVDKSVVRYLRPRADGAGTRFRPPKAFNGWAVLTARKFGSPPAPAPAGYALTVIASPESGADLDENTYHAHISMPPNMDYYSMALHLRQLFEAHGTIERVAKHAAPPPPENRFPRLLLTRFKKWLIERRSR